MVVLFDTCVILDHLLHRQPFAKSSRDILRLSGQIRFEGLITVNQLTDIHYILKRNLHEESKVRNLLNQLLQLINVVDSSTLDVYLALNSKMIDFEDALLVETASRIKADYIVTRNLKDFSNSKVPAISPENLIKLIPEY